MFPLPHICESSPVRCGAGSVIADGNFQGSRKKCETTAHAVQRFETLLSNPRWKLGHIQGLVDMMCHMSALISRFTTIECRTRLVYNINKCLCIVPNEATNRITRIVVRKNRLDQGGEFMGGKRALDQMFTGWALKLRKRKG